MARLSDRDAQRLSSSCHAGGRHTWEAVEVGTGRPGSRELSGSVAVTLLAPGAEYPRVRNALDTLSTAAGRWGDLEAATYSLHPHLGKKRVSVDNFYASVLFHIL